MVKWGDTGCPSAPSHPWPEQQPRHASYLDLTQGSAIFCRNFGQPFEKVSGTTPWYIFGST